MSRTCATRARIPAVPAHESRFAPYSTKSSAAVGRTTAHPWRWIPFLAGGTVVAVAGAVLCGWLLDSALLKRLVPGTAAMQASTAVAFILCALGLLQRAEAGPRRSGFRWAVAGVVCLLAAFVVARWLAGGLEGPEHLLVLGLSQFAAAPIEGRMPIATGVNFLLLGGALVLIDTRRGFWPAQVMIAGTVVMTLMAFLGFAYHTASLEAGGIVRPFALHSVLLFLLLGFGLLAVCPDRGFLAMVRARSLGDWLLRRLLPAALVVPFVLGWLILLGQDAGWYRPSLALALFALANIIVFATIVGWSAAIVNRMAASRQGAERALSASEERFRLLVDAVEDYAIMMLDREGRVTSWSHGAERIFGYRAEAILGDHFSRFFPEADAANGKPARELAEAVAHGHYLAEGWRVRQDGSRFWGDSVTSVVRDQAGEVSGFARVTRDVSERKQAEEKARLFSEELEHRVAERTAELEAANKELEAFSYSVSHDLRAPLRAIDGFSRIVVQRYAAALPAEGQQYLGDVRAATQQMGRLIDDLLKFARLSRQPLRKEQVPHRALVEDCLADLRKAHPERSVEVRLGDVADCQADMSMLKQVWANLLSNALKYTGQRTAAEIEIGSRPGADNGEIIFFVKDNGVGFDMRYAHKLFGVFQRLHRAEEYEGTGVGLAIVQRIVQRHGGRIWAEAEPDKGATFSFTLP